MEFSFKKINIESPTPTTQFGHSCQTYKLSEYHDNLYARAIGFKKDSNWIIHLSMDLLCFKLEPRNELQDYIRNYYHNNNIHLITSTTHTHYANNPTDETYKPWLLETLKKEITSMEYKTIDNVSSSFQKIHTKTLGKSRISGYESENEYLSIVKFYENDNNFLNILICNCHPTILEAHTQFFSSEYPGYILKRLEEKHPNTNFSFIQGAAGDISTRFTRDGQDYDALIRLADKFLIEVEGLLNTKCDTIPLKLNYNEVFAEYEHDLSPIDLSNLRNDLTPRELETIKFGQEVRKKYDQKIKEDGLFTILIKDAVISSLDLGCVKIKFFPNEIFSAYMDYIDLDKEMLVSYSNGYGPYVLPIDFPYITYEMFTDTLSKSCKEKLINIIKTI